MKMIDLLNMISKGEEVPKKIKYLNIIYKAAYGPNGDLLQYVDITNDDEFFSYYCVPLRLNDEVEILEEEKKIPEKLEQIMSKKGKYNSIDELAEEVFKAFETIDDLIINQNKIIDCLESKGDE